MKITSQQIKEGKTLYKKLVQRAWESATFKEQLIANPSETISQLEGSKVNRNTRIVVEDQTDENTIYLNIPAKLDLDDFELTEEQLEMMAGGIFPAIIAGLALGAAAKRVYDKYF